MSSKLEIEYPTNLPDVLQTTRARFEQEAKMAMAVKLFEMRRLSSGMAAALVGMDRVSFLLRLSDFGVPMIDLDADELAEDVANARVCHRDQHGTDHRLDRGDRRFVAAAEAVFASRRAARSLRRAAGERRNDVRCDRVCFRQRHRATN